MNNTMELNFNRTLLDAMASDDYLDLDATEMARRVREEGLAPGALLGAALQRCEHVNDKVNAVVMDHSGQAIERMLARAEAGASRQGALAGVPMLLKDLNTYLAGTRTTNGSRLLANAPLAEHSSTVTQRYEQAGMLIFGKTASPEFGLTTTTESAQWGATRNPWNLVYSAGGSSGGAAAAVAAGIVPAAHATDGGGSIRIPASYCGVFGLKPTRYRTPQGPSSYEGWFGASCGHVVSRSVRDSALLLDISHGHEPGSPYWLAPIQESFVEQMKRNPASLRIGLVSRNMTDVPLDPDVKRVLDETVTLLCKLGHEIEEVDLPIDAGQVFSAHGVVTSTTLLTAVKDREAVMGCSMEEEQLEPISRYLLANARNTTAETLFRARRAFESIGQQMELMLDRFDLLLSPVTASLTPKLELLSLQNRYEDYTREIVGSVAYTVLANVSGQPSMSVPSGLGRERLPIGMMFTAGRCREGLLLSLARQLEQSRPWAHLRAPL